jgi:pilus assembly protein Flp/PilA
MKQFLLKLFADESGQDLVEYAMILALLAMGVIASARTVANGIAAVFTNVGTTLSSAS